MKNLKLTIVTIAAAFVTLLSVGCKPSVQAVPTILDTRAVGSVSTPPAAPTGLAVTSNPIREAQVRAGREVTMVETTADVGKREAVADSTHDKLVLDARLMLRTALDSGRSLDGRNWAETIYFLEQSRSAEATRAENQPMQQQAQTPAEAQPAASQ
jgi:hypothetical protein